MFDLTGWLARQDVYDQQVQNLSENIVLVKHKESGAWHKVKIAVETATRYLVSQEALWLRRSSTCQPIKCHASEGNADYQLVIMDYLDGVCLSDLLRKAPDKLNWSDLMVSLFNNINNLHSQGIVHNDIKPNNIIVRNDEMYLIDLASSGWLNQQYSSKKFKSYTPVYALPDSYLLTSFQTVSDWYAYLLLLDLLKTGTIFSLTSFNLDEFKDYQRTLIRSYHFIEQIDAFLMTQLESIN